MAFGCSAPRAKSAPIGRGHRSKLALARYGVHCSTSCFRNTPRGFEELDQEKSGSSSSKIVRGSKYITGQYLLAGSVIVASFASNGQGFAFLC